MKIEKYTPLIEKLFPKGYQLIEGTDDIFELDLALWEYENLSKAELIDRSAFFKTVSGIETIHFKTCNLHNLEEIHKESSFRTKIFFLNGKYSTGYSTHGLFPYRGKFHPQLIRALLNILKIKKGDVVLDPMAGSSTVSVEANLLDLDSISVDLSPFCNLMGEVKTFALNLDIEILQKITKNSIGLLNGLKNKKILNYLLTNPCDKKKYYEIVLLAFLDAMGFSNRISASIEKLFPRVLERYVATIENFQKARKEIKLKIGTSKIIRASALQLPIEDDSVDVIITSPPYSFAIDYLKNDQPQLEYLGYNLNTLREEMIGLSGRGIENKLELYFKKMTKVLEEMKRVSKKDSFIIIIIGTNEIQTKGVRLESRIIEIAKEQNLCLNLKMSKPIRCKIV